MNSKTRILAGLLLALLATSCNTTPSYASARPGRAAAPSQEQMMARWEAFMTPGAAHQALASRVGTWSLTVRMFTAGAEPTESTGTSVVQWAMDGRYLQDTTSGDFNGQVFRGLGLTGYDNLKRKYVTTWIDNTGTGILYGEGDYDAHTRTFQYRSEGPDLMYSNTYVPMRSTERWVDDDHWLMQSFAPDRHGKEYLAMEIAYARAK